MNAPKSKIVRKRSIFLGHMIHVVSRDRAEQFVASVKSKNRSASHNVVAYVLKSGNLAYCSDDGEPSDTAGKPILNVVKSIGVFDVCVVITRYFGGVLLGTGGLVEAYSAACKALFEEVVFARCCLCVNLKIVLNYDGYSRFEFLLGFFGAMVKNVSYADKVSVDFFIEFSKFNDFKNSLMEKLGLNFSLEVGSQTWQRLEITHDELEKLRLKGK